MLRTMLSFCKYLFVVKHGANVILFREKQMFREIFFELMRIYLYFCM